MPSSDPVVRIVERVAAERGTSPAELGPLHDAIDCDALRHLLSAGFDGRIEFTYAGCRVAVHGDRSIQVEALGPPDGRGPGTER